MSFLSGVPTFAKVVLPIALGAALAGAIAWGASGGGAGQSGPLAAPTRAAAAATVQPEKTPGPPPWDPARPDCPQGWQVYNDPDGYFSLCYPPGLYTSTGPGIPGGGQVFVVRNFPGYNARNPIPLPIPTPVPSGFRVTAYWRPTLPNAGGRRDPCDLNGEVTHLPYTRIPTVIAGRSTMICQSQGENEESGTEPFVVWIPDGSGRGFVEVSGARSGPAAAQNKGLVEQVVSTFKVR